MNFPLDPTQTIGAIAGVCSMVSFAPQAWRIIKTKDTSALSGKTYAITVLGFTCWVIFGWLKGEWPIIAPNIVCLAFAVFIFSMIIMPRQRMEAVAEQINPESSKEK